MYRVEPVPAPAAPSTLPVCAVAEVAVRLLIQTFAKSTSIKLTSESSIVIFSIVREPDVLPG